MSAFLETHYHGLLRDRDVPGGLDEVAE
jgi:hypothetical protein